MLPLDYLSALVLLFMLTVADRACYALGSNAGKAGLLAGQMALLLPVAMSQYWSPAAGAWPRFHLRALLLLKVASFCLSALQLRGGYPPRASYTGAPCCLRGLARASNGMVGVGWGDRHGMAWGQLCCVLCVWHGYALGPAFKRWCCRHTRATCCAHRKRLTT